MTDEPIGVMKCWECIEKHGRDLEHHFEDLVRTTKDPKERLEYEDWIDRIREIRRKAHMRAKGIAVEEPKPFYLDTMPIYLPRKEEEVEFSEPVRVERGEKTYAEIYHEREECDPESFRVIKPNPEHVLTICCPKGQFEAGRCVIGTMAHKIEHLHAEEHKGCSVCEAMA